MTAIERMQSLLEAARLLLRMDEAGCLGFLVESETRVVTAVREALMEMDSAVPFRRKRA